MTDHSFQTNTICRWHGAMRRLPDGRRQISGLAMTGIINRNGQRIDPQGIEVAAFNKNPVMLAGHVDVFADGTPGVIGRWTSVRATPDGLHVVGEEAPRSPVAEAWFNLMEDGFLKALSIGWIPLEWTTNSIDGQRVWEITRAELVEISPVAVPANPEALLRNRAARESRKLVPIIEGIEAHVGDRLDEVLAAAELLAANVGALRRAYVCRRLGRPDLPTPSGAELPPDRSGVRRARRRSAERGGLRERIDAAFDAATEALDQAAAEVFDELGDGASEAEGNGQSAAGRSVQETELVRWAGALRGN